MTIITESLRRIFVRDLDGLRAEIAAYPDDDRVWVTPPGVANAAGTLVLHLAGSIQHYLGTTFGRTAYVRDRAAEFSRRNVPRDQLIAEIDRAIQAAEAGLATLTDADLEKPYPADVGGVRLATGLFLLHLATHLAWHLGQIDYHRRVVTGEAGLIGALSIARLA